jgi:hypothetical protein
MPGSSMKKMEEMLYYSWKKWSEEAYLIFM